MKRHLSLGSNMLWNSIGLLFYFGCQWLLTVFVVYFRRGYFDAGVLSLAMSISNVLGMAACLNLRTFQVSELEGRFSDGDFLANRILASGISVILCLCIVLYQDYEHYEQLCITIFMIFKTSEALGDVLHGFDQKAWRLDIAGKSFLLRGFATLLAMGCGMLLGGSLIVTVLLMAVFAHVVIFFYDYRQCKRQIRINLSYSRKNVLLLVKIGVPLALYSMLLNLISTYPRFQIEEQYGKELLGIFASISTPTVLITQMASFVFNPLMGIFAEHRKEGNKKGVSQLLLFSIGATIAIGVVAAAAGSLLGEWALVLLFGESIRAYTYLFVPIIYTAVLTALIWLLCGLLVVFRDYYMLAGITLISLLFGMGCAPVLIPNRMLTGAVVTLLLSLGLEVLLLLLRLVWILKREK